MPTVLRESAKEFIPKNAIEPNAIAAQAMKRAINRGNYNANAHVSKKIALLPLTNAYPHNPKLKNVGNPDNTWFGPPYASNAFQRKSRKGRAGRKTRKQESRKAGKQESRKALDGRE